MGIEYQVQSVFFEELEEKLNLLAADGWRYRDFVFEIEVSRGSEPGVARIGTLILERTVGEPRK